MLTYIYLVKCPHCEDEYFDFFDEAKQYALERISKQPIITQTEVTRNDFGECTDHCDLGTIWSWEEALGEPEKELDDTVFSKVYTFNCPECDPEFDDLDNSIDPEIEEISERKPIPEGMTIEQLKEAMEENEDAVECAVCEELFPKTNGVKRGHSYVCPTCSKTDVDLAIANLAVDEFEAIDGYDDAEAVVANSDLPEDKQAEILDVIDHIREEEEEHIDELKELKTEDNTLSEDLGDTRSLEELVKDSINHLTNDLGKDPWADDFADDVIADLENNYDIYVPEDMAKYGNWCHNVASEVSRQVNNPDNLTEASLADIAAAANSEFGSDWNSEDLLDKAGIDDFRRVDISTGMTPSEKAEYNRQQAEIAWARDRERSYKNKLSAWKRYKNSKLEELEEATDYKKRLTLCPECGTKESFDHETCFCINCGFNA